mgnify:CR=1 FL=1
MKKKRRVFSTVLALALSAAMILPGCSGGSDNSGGKSESGEERNYDVDNMKFNDVKIHVMTRITNEASQEYFEQKTEEFNNLGKGITVEIENITCLLYTSPSPRDCS